MGGGGAPWPLLSLGAGVFPVGPVAGALACLVVEPRGTPAPLGSYAGFLFSVLSLNCRTGRGVVDSAARLPRVLRAVLLGCLCGETVTAGARAWCCWCCTLPSDMCLRGLVGWWARGGTVGLLAIGRGVGLPCVLGWSISWRW